MDISFFDRYSHLESPLHRLDPRTKILSSFLFIIVGVATPADSHLSFLGYFVLIGFAVCLSRIPLRYVLSRLLIAVPFLGMALLFVLISDIQKGGTEFYEIAMKSSLSILVLTLLSTTTTVPKLLRGFEQLRIPKIFITLFGFTFRYAILFVKELGRMKRAGDARGFGGFWFWHSKVIGHCIGTLFLRSYDRGERIFHAMVARGFDGNYPDQPSAKLGSHDFAVMVLLGIILSLLTLVPIYL